MISKIWTREEIQDNIASSDKWLRRGISAIYRFQTYSEQIHLETSNNNGVGFNSVDAKFLSAMAQNIEKGWNLTPRQADVSRRMMKKYCGQLTKIANRTLT